MEAEGQGLLVSPAVSTPYVSEPANYTGDVVLDRKLVKPGDALHVTGGRQLLPVPAIHGYVRVCIAQSEPLGERCLMSSFAQLMVLLAAVWSKQVKQCMLLMASVDNVSNPNKHLCLGVP